MVKASVVAEARAAVLPDDAADAWAEASTLAYASAFLTEAVTVA